MASFYVVLIGLRSTNCARLKCRSNLSLSSTYVETDERKDLIVKLCWTLRVVNLDKLL